MAQRLRRVWIVTAAATAAGCIAFGITYYPRGLSDEAKYAIAAKRQIALDTFSAGFEKQRIGKTDEAIEKYREAMAVDSSLGSGHYFLGTALLETGKPDEAAKEFDQTIADNGLKAHAYNSRGAIRWNAGDYTGAQRDFQSALSEDPGFPAAEANLGLVLLRNGKAAAAKENFDTVIANLTSPAQATSSYEGRGIARAMLGDKAGAEQDLTAAVEYATGKQNVLRALLNRARLRETSGNGAGAEADRVEYARLKDLPEKSDRFVHPLKGAELPKQEGKASNGF